MQPTTPVSATSANVRYTFCAVRIRNGAKRKVKAKIVAGKIKSKAIKHNKINIFLLEFIYGCV